MIEKILQYKTVYQKKSEFKRIIGENFDIAGQEKINKTMSLAIDLHRGQVRPDRTMCALHLLKVAIIVVVDFGVRDVDTVCAALLHDSIEDQSKKLAAFAGRRDQKSEITAALDYLENNFGKRVRSLVSLLTNRKDDILNKRERNLSYREYVRMLIDNPSTFLIKLADFSSNVFGLDEVKDPVTKRQLANKYKPVIMDFVDRLEQGDCHILNKEELARRLREVYSES